MASSEAIVEVRDELRAPIRRGHGDRAQPGRARRLEAPARVLDRDAVARAQRPAARPPRAAPPRAGTDRAPACSTGVSSAATIAVKQSEQILARRARAGSRRRARPTRSRSAPPRRRGGWRRRRRETAPRRRARALRAAPPCARPGRAMCAARPRRAAVRSPIASKRPDIVESEIARVVVALGQRDAFLGEHVAEARGSAAARCWRSRRRSRKRSRAAVRVQVRLLLPTSTSFFIARRANRESAGGFRAAGSGHS